MSHRVVASTGAKGRCGAATHGAAEIVIPAQAGIQRRSRERHWGARVREHACARTTGVRLWILAVLFCFGASASAQSIFKCKGADGRITYSASACTGEGATLPLTTQPQPAKAPANSAAAGATPSAGAPASSDDAAQPPPTFRAPLPKQCDNKGPLQYVIARLDSAATPDDIRGFLADERFRLLRCEFTRFSAEERRERDAAMRDIEARDAVRRRAAVLRVEALYDRYLNPGERTARARQR